MVCEALQWCGDCRDAQTKKLLHVTYVTMSLKAATLLVTIQAKLELDIL